MENANFESLQTEVEFYRSNQAAVEVEIKALIEDNQKLSQQVGSLLKEKLENARNAENNVSCQDAEEMQKQVSLLTKERDSLHVLWQTSQKTIEALEMELKAYQGSDRGNKDALHDRRDLQMKLDTSLRDYIELESKHKDLTSTNKTLENELKTKEKEITIYKERGKELEGKIEEYSKQLEESRESLAVEKKNCDDLRHQLVMCQKDCVEHVKKEVEAKGKVAEALQLYDVVAGQKEQAYQKLIETTEQLTKVKLTLENVRKDAELHFNKEMEEVRTQYNEKITDMLTHIQNLDKELVEKGLLLNKALREIKVLQSANKCYMKEQKKSMSSMEPKLVLAEQRLEAMFTELVTSQRRNIQLQCDKQCIALDVQRLQDLHVRETKRRDWEEKLLKSECDELRLQVEHLQKSLEETHAMVNKLQTILSSRSEINQKMVSTKEEELQEINKHLENQIQLNQKWKQSYVKMTETLKKRLELLQKENIELKSKLNPAIESNEEESGNS